MVNPTYSHSMALILQTHVHHMEGLHSHTHDEEHEHGHEHEHEHEHELEHEHEHGHDHDHVQEDHHCNEHEHGDQVTLTEVHVKKEKKFKKAVKWAKSHLKHSHSHKQNENINLRAALIHCLGDIVQSIGVIIAAYIIRFKVSVLMT